MYRKSTSQNMSRPLYKCCDYCGRNDHKVAVRVERTRNRQGNLSHPVVGYCTSCYALNVERNTETAWPVPGTVVYDTRGPAAMKKHPTVKAAPKPVAGYAVFAVANGETFRVSGVMTETEAHEMWDRLDTAGHDTFRFFEVRQVVATGDDFRAEGRHDRAPFAEVG
jgi:hypothetical protein